MSDIEEPLDGQRRAVVADYWWRRAEGELTSWVGVRHVLADLAEEGAPATLLALAGRGVAGEVQHSAWCKEWAMHFGHPAGDISVRSERPVSFASATREE